MKKRLLSLLLALVMLVGMIPATAITVSAESNYSVWVGGVGMNDGDYLANGATATQTTKPSGGYAYYKDGTLTLNNYSYKGWGYQYNSDQGFYATVFTEQDLTLELVGFNTLTQTALWQSDVICVGARGKPDLTVDGNGKLIGTTDTGVGLFAGGDITINGGTIAVTTHQTGIMSLHENVIINGGDIIAESDGSGSAIYAGCDVTINCGNVTAISAKRAIVYGTSLTIAKDLNIQASTTVDGELGEYVAANHSNYKKIVTTLKSGVVYNVNVSATFSGTSAKATTSTTGATVTATKWYKKNGSSWTELSASDTIKEGNTYRCEVTVGATGDYKLTDGYTVKINGTAATKKSGNTWYRDVTITGYTSYVDVDDIDLPEAFINPDFTYNDEEGAAYHWDVVQVEWFECDKDGHILSGALTENDVFKKDTYYRIEVTVVPETNWQFHGSQLSVYINGKAANYLYGYNKAYADSVTGYLVYNTADIEGDYELFVYDDSLSGSAKNIYIKDGQYLGSDATAPSNTKPASGGYAYYKDGVLELNGYDNEKAHFIFEELALELYLVGDNTIGAIYDNEWDYASNLEVRQGNLVIDAADGGKLTIASNPLDAYANIQVKDLYFNGGELTSCLANGTYGAAVQLNGGNLYLENGYVAYVSDTNDFASATKWDGKTDIGTYDCVWIVPKPEIYVGGVCMGDGDYLAVGATATQTTKPSGGYAYYNDGTLTLNNYSYEGEGYQYISIGYCAIVYAKQDLTVELVGTNSLVQERKDSDVICIESEGDGGCITIDGTGSLSATTTVGYAGIEVDGTLTVNGGTIDCVAKGSAMISRNQDIIINGGNVTASGRLGLNAPNGNVKINGGNVLATGTTSTWGAISCAKNFTVAEGMKIQASTTVDGALGEYVASKHSNYKKIVIEPAPTHTVTFKVDSTTVATKTVEDGKTVTAPADPTQSGKTFLGWYNGDTKFDFTTPITGDITLTAKFEDATSTVKLGDVNLDGNVDYLDLQRLYQHLSTSNALTGEALAVANVNGDTTVDYFDLQRLYQHLSTDNKLF